MRKNFHLSAKSIVNASDIDQTLGSMNKSVMTKLV